MPKIKIFNTLSTKEDFFKPRNGKKVNLFVCGPIVYDYSHIGNARTYIIFDSFARYLKHFGYSVFYLQNIINIDDKIIARAREKGVSPKDLALAFEKEYLKDIKSLGITSVSKYVRTTNYIKEIISQIGRLKEKGYAYILEGDGVYFDISKSKKYGNFSGRTSLVDEDAVSRVDYSRHKKNRGDFCLWKLKQEYSEPSWLSPFGEGRPGWHIADTAICEKFFGAQHDIHGGARDLIFPHHEDSIAQMEALFKKKYFAKYWMHVGFLTIDGQKMSNSANNHITIGDFLRRCPANYLRFFVVKNLWSLPIDYTESTMNEVRSDVNKIEEFLRKIKYIKSKNNKKIKTSNSKIIKKFEISFYTELSDNFNTPKAFAIMFEFIKNMNVLLEQNQISKQGAIEIYKIFESINKIFGILNFKK